MSGLRVTGGARVKKIILQCGMFHYLDYTEYNVHLSNLKSPPPSPSLSMSLSLYVSSCMFPCPVTVHHVKRAPSRTSEGKRRQNSMLGRLSTPDAPYCEFYAGRGGGGRGEMCVCVCVCVCVSVVLWFVCGV